MSSNSFWAIAALRTHAQAVHFLKTTTPIRGYNPPVVPLGNRRDHQRFTVRASEDGSIECVYYNTPLVTFHPQPAPGVERITVGAADSKHTEWSRTDADFIQSVCRTMLVARRKGSVLILEPRQSRSEQMSKILMPSCKPMTFDVGSDGCFTPVEGTEVKPLTAYRLDRRATNIVRARYGAFYRYMKGLMAVRRVITHEEKWSAFKGWMTEEVRRIPVTTEELLGIVPTRKTEQTMTFFDTDKVQPTPNNKPSKLAHRWLYTPTPMGVNKSPTDEWTSQPYERWLANTKAFTDLALTPADDPDQHEKFRQAFVWLLFYTSLSTAHSVRMGLTMNIKESDISATMDEIIFKYHSEEVLVPYELKHGQVPSNKYDTWVTR